MRTIHKILLFQLLFLYLSCSQAQTSQKQWTEKPNYWVPNVDIMVAFPAPPVFFEERTSAKYLSETRHYQCQRAYQSDSTYFWDVGVYRNKDNENTTPTIMLNRGVTMSMKKNMHQGKIASCQNRPYLLKVKML